MVKNIQGYVGDSVIKKLHVNADDTGQGSSIPGSGRSPEAGYRNPLHYSYLKKTSRFPQKAPKRPEPNSKFSSYLVLLIYVKSIL